MERLIRAVSISVVLFFVVLGLVIGTRMDQNTIALLGGTVIGLLIAAPCAAIVTYLAVRHREDSMGANRVSPTYHVVPQNFVVPSPPSNQLPQQYLPPAPFVLPPQRKFYVIGGDGGIDEVSADQVEQ